MSEAWLVVGLGNPGARYARNRHNVGYMVLDVLAERTGSRFSQHKKARARVAEGRLGMMPGGAPGPRVILAEPSVLMNLSGGPVAGLVSYYGIDPASRLLVVHDELDLDLGRMRLKAGGGDNGHNGLKSIRAHLRTGDFNRVRFGVGRPPGRMNPADYVLSNFPARDQNDLDLQVTLAADAVEMIMTDGLAAAQNRYNT
mgnify:CR=1 FL=1